VKPYSVVLFGPEPVGGSGRSVINPDELLH
jgi:hypothetical protein